MTQYGYWRTLREESRRAILDDYGVINKVWYLFPQGGGPRNSFTTFTDLAPNLRSRDLIYLGGVLREQAVAPLDIYDVTLLGVANTPRQSTSGGVPTGGGATWMAPASGAVAATPLLELRAQGWNIENISFTPHTSSAGIRLTRSASVDTIDAGHFRISNCLFAAQGGSGQIGIEDTAGSGFGIIEDCRFLQLTGTAIKGLGTGADNPTGWRITRNRFNANTHAIAINLKEGLVDHNYIRQTADDTNFKVNFNAAGTIGSFNQVIKNIFSDVVANITIAKGYKPGTSDVWRNWGTGAADEIIVVPA
jgi:hypothetical protein